MTAAQLRSVTRHQDLPGLEQGAAGLDAGETRRFGAILTEIIARRGTGILLVEHDMALVMDVCQYLYVIDFGEPIFEGTPDEVRRSEVVRAAYLGSKMVETQEVR